MTLKQRLAWRKKPVRNATSLPFVDWLRDRPEVVAERVGVLGHSVGAGAALLLFTLVVALMSLFLPGRDDEMLRNNPALYLDVQSWFMLG